MDTTTKEGMARRLAEINGAKIEFLKRKYREYKDKKFALFAQGLGLDTDYIAGYDDEGQKEIIK